MLLSHFDRARRDSATRIARRVGLHVILTRVNNDRLADEFFNRKPRDGRFHVRLAAVDDLQRTFAGCDFPQSRRLGDEKPVQVRSAR